MRTTIDRGGRVVIPKSIREQAGLQAGAEVDVKFRDGRIEIEPAAVPMHLAKRSGGVAIEVEAELPELTTEAVRDVLERVRR
jgi:AbrB family looped-hinge helix DNA binding protein